MGIISTELSRVTKKVEKAIEDWATETYNDIRNDTPEDTGNLQASWKFRRPSRLNYVMFTDPSSISYADVIANGRRTINGKTYGSTQGWGLHGLWNYLDIKEKELERKIRNVR